MGDLASNRGYMRADELLKIASSLEMFGPDGFPNEKAVEFGQAILALFDELRQHIKIEPHFEFGSTEHEEIPYGLKVSRNE